MSANTDNIIDDNIETIKMYGTTITICRDMNCHMNTSELKITLYEIFNGQENIDLFLNHDTKISLDMELQKSIICKYPGDTSIISVATQYSHWFYINDQKIGIQPRENIYIFKYNGFIWSIYGETFIDTLFEHFDKFPNVQNLTLAEYITKSGHNINKFKLLMHSNNHLVTKSVDLSFEQMNDIIIKGPYLYPIKKMRKQKHHFEILNDVGDENTDGTKMNLSIWNGWMNKYLVVSDLYTYFDSAL